MTLLSLILLFILLFVNYILYKKLSYSKKFFIISSLIIILNYIIIISIYYNNIFYEFEHGIFFGDKLGMFANDEYKYFMESRNLTTLLNENGLSSWFNKTLEPFPYTIDNKPYGIYNNYIAFLGFLGYFGFETVTELITIKLIFTLFNSYLIFDISKKYLNNKSSYLLLIVLNLCPTYLLVNGTLVRDNIILFAILSITKILINKKYDIKNIVLLIISSILLFDLRSYTLLAIFVSAIFVIKQSKNRINKFDILFFVITIVSLFILDKFTFPIPHIQYLKENFNLLYGTGVSGIILFLISTLKEIFIRGLFLNTLPTGSIYILLTISGAIYYMIFFILFIYKIILLFINKNNFALFKYTIYFILLNSMMLMLKDGFIPSRLSLMWTFNILLIILIPINKFDIIPKKFK